MRAPFSYKGGKAYLYKKIIALFPSHITYVEPFGGAAWVLLNKSPSPVEVYNDIDGDLVNFFRVLRDEGEELQHRLILTPYSRQEYVSCLENCDEPVERARRTFVRLKQVFSGVMNATPGRWGYVISHSRRGMAGTVSNWLSMIDHELPAIIARLRTVQIEGLNAIDVIQKYDAPETLFYCDPPYLPDTRVDKRIYHHEMTMDQHRDLLSILCSVKGKVILSGHSCELYQSWLGGWQKHKFDVACRTDLCSDRPRSRRTEIVWLNPVVVQARQNLITKMIQDRDMANPAGDLTAGIGRSDCE